MVITHFHRAMLSLQSVISHIDIQQKMSVITLFLCKWSLLAKLFVFFKQKNSIKFKHEFTLKS